MDWNSRQVIVSYFSRHLASSNMSIASVEVGFHNQCVVVSTLINFRYCGSGYREETRGSNKTRFGVVGEIT